jgi:hypothetical protein
MLQALFEAGSSGLLPKDLAVKLERFKVKQASGQQEDSKDE